MIESKQNKYFKEVISLQMKKYVDKLNRFIIEGKKFVLDIPSNVEIYYFIVSEEFSINNNIQQLESRATVIICSDILFDELSSTINSQGILAVCKKTSVDINSIKFNDNFFVVICENIQDPGNLGTIIRTSESVGANLLVTTFGSCSVYNQKTIRSTAGAIFNLPVIEGIHVDELYDVLRRNNIKLFGTHLRGSKFYYQADFTQNLGIVIGNEGNGMSDSFANKCDELIKIPMVGKSESLNAAIASSIVIYDVLRQRNISII